ncbi:hypothetical protein Pint_12142 [Pistacia integerrima]|uniref:Uncharacterized protein n=1 Tax=Pistacia integerrima TaxID=434235 RepID=A0ACC0XGI1_9ROSI|nr:hypothetical protein Pint_12142 [Pistacia integerrima]
MLSLSLSLSLTLSLYVKTLYKLFSSIEFAHVGENSNLYLNNGVPLHKAALKGDWKSAKKLLEKDPTMLCAGITKGNETVLHIAAGARQTGFVEGLIKLIQSEDLTLQDQKKKIPPSVAPLQHELLISLGLC